VILPKREQAPPDGIPQTIDDAVCIAAMETVLKPLGIGRSFKGVPWLKADMIEAMRSSGSMGAGFA
jgi:hypothetical protein